MKFVFALAVTVFSFSTIAAQSSNEIQSIKENLLEVQANIADLQSKDPTSPDLAKLIEKRDFLQLRFEELTNVQGGSGGVMTGKALPGQKGSATTGKSDKNPESVQSEDQKSGTSAGSTSTSGRTSAKTLANLKKEVSRLRALNSQSPAVKEKIRSYEKRIEAIEKANSK